MTALAMAAAAARPDTARAQAGGETGEALSMVRPPPGEVALEYTLDKGAEACPDETVLRSRTLVYFGLTDPFVPRGTAAPWRIRVTIAKAARGYRAVMSKMHEGMTPTESIDEQPTCGELVWSLASWMSLVLSHPAPASPPCPACPPREPCPAPKLCPAPPQAPACDAACEENIKKKLCAQYGLCLPMGPTLSLMGGGLLTLGWTLNVGPGLWLGGQVGWEHFTIGVEARGIFPESMGRGYDGLSLSDLVTFSGLVVPCARWKVLFGCAFVEAGEFIYTAPGRYGGGGDDSGFLFAFGPRGGVDLPIAGGFSIRGFADLVIHPYAPTVGITEGGDPNHIVHVLGLPIVNGFVSFGIGWTK